MELFNNEPLFDRLLKTLSGVMPGGRQVRRESMPLSGDLVERIMGSPEEFMQRYQNFEDEYYRALSDKKNLKLGVSVDVIQEKNNAFKIDMSRLTYSKQRELKEQFLRNVLRMESLLPEAGLPGIEFPSQNLYSALTRYDLQDFTHPASVLLNTMFFNVDPYKQGLDALGFSTSGLMNTEALERARRPIELELDKKLLTFDVETSGVTQDSQVRQFAYQIEKTTADGRRVLLNPDTLDEMSIDDPLRLSVRDFISPQMNEARVTRSGMSTSLSDLVGGNIEMGEGGKNFLEESNRLLKTMKDVDYISGHNVTFDLDMLFRTMRAQESFGEDSAVLINEVREKIRGGNYLIDTAVEMRRYLFEKASERVGGDADRASKIVSQMLGPETMTRIGMGGSTAPASVENIALNTNLLDLMEQDDPKLAQAMAKKLKEGSHVADTDVSVQASMDRYKRSGKLDFRFDMDSGKPGYIDNAGNFVEKELSEFETFARNQILKSKAITPTTNLASTQVMSDTIFEFAKTEEGLRRMEMLASSSDFGLDGDYRGILRFNKQANQFQFTRFGAPATVAEDVDMTLASNYMRETLIQARQQGEGVSTTLRVAGESISVTRNLPDEKIINFGLNFIQQTGVDQRVLAQGIVGSEPPPSIAANQDTFIRSLGLTNEQFAMGVNTGGVMQRIQRGLAGQSLVAPIRNPLDYDQDVINSYYDKVTKAGLSFRSLDVKSRAMAVGMAEASYKIAKEAPSAAYAKNADLLTEMGFSFFKMQDTARLGVTNAEGELFSSSKVMAPFMDLFDVTTVTDARGITATENLTAKFLTSSSGVSGNILETDLNRFTLSYVSGSGDPGNKMAARVNLVFGANNTLSKEQSREFADYMLNNVETFRDTLESVKSIDEDLGREIGELTNFRTTLSTMGNDNREKLAVSLAEHIRERGAVIGYAEGEDAVQGFTQAIGRKGYSLVDNDVNLTNIALRAAHVDKESGILVMSAASDRLEDQIVGRTSEAAQREAAAGFQAYQEASEILTNDPKARRQARRVVQDARDAGAVDRAVDLSRRAMRDVGTPMADFFRANKKPIGFTALGLAAAGIGYYMYNKNKEQRLYNESMAAMPTEPVAGSTSRPPVDPEQMPRSTRRDPLVTAGVVGNLDRNKIGHTQMGPNKYNHLYGG